MAIIDKPSDYFNTKLYTGNGSTNAITGVGFQPDWVWIKDRDNVRNHVLNDAVRGATENLFSNTTGAEATDTTTLTAFNSDGFTLSSGTKVNGNSINFASWNWKEQTGVFDIVSFTGNGSARTISHSLGSVPTFYVVKSRSNDTSWACYHQSQGPTKIAGLFNDQSAPEAGANFFNNTAPTSSVFSVGSDATLNGNGRTFICYLFGDSSMSKMGSYTGNGSTNGTFVYLNFKPALIIVKCTSASNENWMMLDNKRDGYNVENEQLFTNTTGVEESNAEADFLSNGFKLRRDNSRMNGSGATYMYLAFAENPFVTSTGVPATAR
jgi:hypothetical protein